jgi:hypothetical protein
MPGRETHSPRLIGDFEIRNYQNINCAITDGGEFSVRRLTLSFDLIARKRA